MAAETRWKRTQFLHLTLSFTFSVQLIWSLDAPVLLNTCENSDQRSKLVYHQIITHTNGKVQSSLAIWIRAPAWIYICHTYMPYIADGSLFHKEFNFLEVRTMIKNSPEKQSLSESDPLYFSIVFFMILRSYKVGGLQVSPFKVRLEQKLC